MTSQKKEKSFQAVPTVLLPKLETLKKVHVMNY